MIHHSTQILSPRTAGFTLIQLSIILMVGGLALTAILPGGSLGDHGEKEAITKRNMQRIEDATKAFMARNLRRPCPADNSLDNSDTLTYGFEAVNPGACTGGLPAANFTNRVVPTGNTTRGSNVITGISSMTNVAVGSVVQHELFPTGTMVTAVAGNTATVTNPAALTLAGWNTAFNSVAAGGVPFKTLGLPEEVTFDGWGRRMTYLVDTRATLEQTCRDMQSNNMRGSLLIRDTSTTAMVADTTMWALLSYGKDPHGAFPMQGSFIADRFITNNTDPDTLVNAFVDATFANAFSGSVIRRTPTATFDDTLWVQESSKNTCCIGKSCLLGFRLDSISSTGISDIVSVATGDINGDGMTDLVVGNPVVESGKGRVYVYFGNKTGWPNLGSSTLLHMSAPPYSLMITNDYPSNSFGRTIAVGNIDGDAFDDILIGSDGDTGIKGIYTVFYGNNTDTVNVAASSLSGPNGFGLEVEDDDTVTGPVRIADINGDGAGDLIMMQAPLYNKGYIVYGGARPPMGTAIASMAAITNASTPVAGFKISSPSFAAGVLANGNRQLAAGDLNGDGMADIVIGDSNNRKIYVLFGRARGGGLNQWPLATMDLPTELATTNATRFGSVNVGFASGITVADLNDDGFQDILAMSNATLFGYRGRAVGTWPALAGETNINTSNDYDIAIALNAGMAGGAFGTLPYSLSTADMNNDGKRDIVMGTTGFSPVYDGTPRSNAGGIWVLFQRADRTFPLDLFSTALDGVNSFRIDGGKSGFNDGIATSVSGDFNGDGKMDMIINSSNPTGGGFGPPTYVLFGRKNVPWDSIVDLNCINDRNGDGC